MKFRIEESGRKESERKPGKMTQILKKWLFLLQQKIKKDRSKDKHILVWREGEKDYTSDGLLCSVKKEVRGRF